MEKKHLNLMVVLGIVLFFVACNSKPQVVEHEPSIPGESHQVNSNPKIQQEIEDHHFVTVEEVLQAEKYTYLNVKENEETFWIAVPGQEVTVGEKVAYKGGLKKKDFESKEFKRVFETIYLVSGISKGGQASPGKDISQVEGSIKIKDIITNPSKYEGKTIIVAGLCAKVNPQIMGKNWVHLKDGSADDYDFTITTQDNIPVGSNVAMKGIIYLDKDFGAGYVYEIIMEEATIIK
jgi:hypothetical protein